MKSRSLIVASLAMGLTTSAFSPISAQERCRMSWEIQPADASYTQQHAIMSGTCPVTRFIAASRTTSPTAKG